MKSIKLNKCTVQWQYPADLLFFEVIDRIGLDLKDEFPDWSRSGGGNQLVMYNNETLRSAVFGLKVSETQWYGIDGSLDPSEFAVSVFKKFQRHLSLTTVSELAIRCSFGLTVEHSFENAVSRINSRFLQSNKSIDDILSGKMTDNMYSVHVRSPDGWKEAFNIGATTRDEWLKLTASTTGPFTSGKNEKFVSFTKDLPDVLLLIDCSFSHEVLEQSKFSQRVKHCTNLAMQRAKKIIEYYKKG